MNNHLEELLLAYMNEEIEYDVIVDYCYNIKVTEENMNELMYCIRSFDLEVLYRTLLTAFDNMLTDEQKKYYIYNYDLTFDPKWGLNEQCF